MPQFKTVEKEKPFEKDAETVEKYEAVLQQLLAADEHVEKQVVVPELAPVPFEKTVEHEGAKPATVSKIYQALADTLAEDVDLHGIVPQIQTGAKFVVDDDEQWQSLVEQAKLYEIDLEEHGAVPLLIAFQQYSIWAQRRDVLSRAAGPPGQTFEEIVEGHKLREEDEFLGIDKHLLSY